MAHALSARTPFGPNVRIALVTGVSLALLGAVTIVLPLQRLSAVTSPEAAAFQTFPKFKPANAAIPSADEPAEPSHDQLIAMTFDLLQALSKEPLTAQQQTFTRTPAPEGNPEVVTTAAAARPADTPPTAPTTRVVRTTAITIRPNLAPVIAPPEPIPEATAVATELDVAETAPPAVESVVVKEPTPVASSNPDLRIVAGQGVNVRSGPGKSKEKLFALPGGAEVRIGASERGWYEVTDDQGRTGWVYKDYLLSP
ncbi:MAG: SH3 domain-containing protein [Devosia sp.]